MCNFFISFTTMVLFIPTNFFQSHSSTPTYNSRIATRTKGAGKMSFLVSQPEMAPFSTSSSCRMSPVAVLPPSGITLASLVPLLEFRFGQSSC